MVFFFYGPNSYAARRRLQELVTTYVAKSGTDFGLERIDGVTSSPSLIKVSLQAVPFLANSRLVIIDNYGRNKAAVEGLESLVGDIPETTVAVFFDSEVDRRTSYFKTLTRLAKVVVFENLTQPQLVAWALMEVKRQGGTADRVAIMALVERVGDDQWRLAQELGKLVNFAPHINREAVETMVEPSFNETIFALIEAVTTGRADLASKLYAGLVADKTNEIYILTMLTWQARNLLMAKVAPPMAPGDLAKATGMSPYVAGKTQVAARQFDEEQLRAMMTATIETEYQIKSGQVSMNLAVEQLIYRLVSRSVHPAA